MKKGLGWMHIKDYRHPSPAKRTDHVDEEALKNFVSADMGDSGHEAILRDFATTLPKLKAKLHRRGIPGVFLDLEPHVKGGGQFGGLQRARRHGRGLARPVPGFWTTWALIITSAISTTSSPRGGSSIVPAVRRNHRAQSMSFTPPPARRSWFQFSLTSILMLTFIVAAFCAGLTFSNRELEQAMQAEKEARVRAEELEKQARHAEQMAKANEKEALRQRIRALANLNKAAATLKSAQDERANAQWALQHEQYKRRLVEAALKKAENGKGAKASDNGDAADAKQGDD